MTSRPFHRLVVTATAGLALIAGAAPALAGETVTVTSRVIYPGEAIPADALREVVLRDGKVPPSAVAMSMNDIEGKVARRTLLPGRYIPMAAVRDAWLVEQGASVQLVFVSGPLTISAAAVTLQPGSAGDLVKVRNVDSGKVISGTVMADGTIRVSDL
ncbi:flagella basal body P-ring formation protein FlgA [Mesorhizobium soli]|jgi:flagella basal body P-ring formation protein FlgA|uniref:flagellar basal body P-ring formation chaperone FlgA n=1 Tax=Pseudaminobacter soli (ex Li et al. 2025) TaxID=1295366 RepID=UPI0024736BFD|nr:flagellar basal body P-ring formation chaperone FlgA [Mesorhizobium soli]MDH6233374.1 flagella basal body P-ring formation protein FlgA [Mesorhizobium soli]